MIETNALVNEPRCEDYWAGWRIFGQKKRWMEDAKLLKVAKKTKKGTSLHKSGHAFTAANRYMVTLKPKKGCCSLGNDMKELHDYHSLNAYLTERTGGTSK